MIKILVAKASLIVLPRLMWAYLKIVAATSRITVHGEQHPDGLYAVHSGFIYAFWHNRQIILPMIRKGEPIHCLISSSRDGEYIARVAGLFGKTSIRGSTTRGGFEAMKQMLRVLGSHGILAMTPDGPLGPAQQVKPGVIQLSRSADSPVIPIAYAASRKKIFASWDGFNLPYPFSRIAIVFGEPFSVAPSESVDAACLRLKLALDEVTAEAERLTLGN